MKKLLRSTDKILTGLALFGDLLLEGYTRSHGFGWSRSWSEALSLKNSTFRSGVSRLLKTGDIEKVIDKKGNACFKLTSPGKEKFERFYPLAKLFSKPWDGKWRVVVFDIKEKRKKSRESLRYKLLSLGFGKLQESVYVTPLDILVDLKEFLKAGGLFGDVLVFEAREVLGFGSKTIANYLWHLDKLDEEYRDLISDFKMANGDEKEMKKLKERYFGILIKDPLLPRELLPEDWLGFKAKNLLFGSR